MSPLVIILIVILVVILFGGYAGRGSYGSNAYYGPGIGLLGLLVIVFLILILAGVVRI